MKIPPATLGILVLILAGLGLITLRDPSQPSAYADVLSVRPAVQPVADTREICRQAVVTHERDPDDARRIISSVAGLVVGGVIEDRFDAAAGIRLASIGGSPTGPSAGQHLQHAMAGQDRLSASERICVTVIDSRMQHDGYDVTYRWAGQDHARRLPTPPGRRIPVINGQLAPAD